VISTVVQPASTSRFSPVSQDGWTQAVQHDAGTPTHTPTTPFSGRFACVAGGECTTPEDPTKTLREAQVSG
jgi:hypothetical protein